MNLRRPASNLHVHVGRLVIDADVPGSAMAHEELARQLEASLSALGGAGDATRPPSARWLDSVASAVATRVDAAVPGRQAP